MALFDSLIAEIDSKFGLGAKSSAFIAEVIRFMTRARGIAGFLDRLKRVSLAWSAPGWATRTPSRPKASNDTAEGQYQNRRIECAVLP